MQRLTSLFPDAHFPLQAARCPPASIRAYGHGPSGINCLGKDGVANLCSDQQRIAYLNALQICPPNVEMGEIQTVQVSTLQPQQGHQVRRSIPLRIAILLAQLAEQTEQPFL